MREAVTDLLAARARGDEHLRRPVAASFAAHAVLIAIAVLVPALWPHAQAPTPVMVINLGAGVPGPRTGGINPIGGRPVERAAPPPKFKEVIPPAAPKSNAMPLPVKKPEPIKAVTPPKETLPNPPAVKRPPTTGDKVRPGTTAADTGAQGMGTGLSSGGAGGSPLTTDQPFCCMDYLDAVSLKMQQIVNGQSVTQHGTVRVRFTIERDGSTVDAQIEQPSGAGELNFLADRALKLFALEKLPPLPAAFDGPRLTIHLVIRY